MASELNEEIKGLEECDRQFELVWEQDIVPAFMDGIYLRKEIVKLAWRKAWVIGGFTALNDYDKACTEALETK